MSPPPEDTIDLLINGKEVLCAKEYDVVIDYMTTPATFSMTVGSGRTVLDLMRAFPPNSLFALRVNGIVQFVGYTDGWDRVGGGAAEIAISGRDRMAQLIRDHIENERSFTNATFEDLASAAIKGAGITESTLFYDAASLRAAVSGTPIVDSKTISTTTKSAPVVGKPGGPELVITGVSEGAGVIFGVAEVRQGTTTVETTQKKVVSMITGFKAEKPIKWDAGESWFGAAKKDFDRAGIFLRAGVDPDGLDPNIFFLGTPDGQQPAKFWLLNTRRENTPDNAVLVGPPEVRYVMTGRHAEYVVLGQAGGGKDGRKQVIGRFHDAEAADAGITAKLVKKDPQAKNTRQADFLARKLCAEERRSNRSFTYTILHRHTVPLISDPRTRIVPCPDLVGHVRDDEIGLNAPLWVQRVQHHKGLGSGTYTKLTLIDPDDLVFGADDPGAPVPGRPTKKHTRKK